LCFKLLQPSRNDLRRTESSNDETANEANDQEDRPAAEQAVHPSSEKRPPEIRNQEGDADLREEDEIRTLAAEAPRACCVLG
jgi:hypothetical protein